MDNGTSYKWSFKKKGKVWDFYLNLFFSKRAIFWVGKRGGDFPLAKGCFLSEMGYFSFSTPLKMGMAMVFFLKGRDLLKGLFQGWLGREEVGLFLKVMGWFCFFFSSLFERGKWSRKEFFF
jgi:hypothetical protein